MGGMDLIFTFALVRHLLGPPGLPGHMTSTSWTHIAILNTPNKGTTHLQLPTYPHYPTHPLPPAHPLYIQSMILQ